MSLKIKEQVGNIAYRVKAPTPEALNTSFFARKHLNSRIQHAGHHPPPVGVEYGISPLHH